MIDQHKTLAEKFIKKGFWLYLFSFIIAPIGYIIKIIISGELSVSEVGILYGVISLIMLVSSFNDFGMTESLNHFIPRFFTEKRFDKIKSILMYAFCSQMITGILLGLFFFFGADFIAANYFKTSQATDILKIFCLFFIGTNVFHIATTFFIATQNTFYNKLVDFFRMAFSLVCVLGVFFFDVSSLVNYSYAWIAGLYLGIIVAVFVFYTKYYYKYLSSEKILWETSLFKTVFSYAIWVLLGAQAATILGQMDMQMIIYLLDTTQAGYYTNYLSIIGIPFLLIGPIFGLLFPIFSEMHSKGHIEKIRQIKSIFLKNFIAVGIAFNILFFVFSEIIAFILFGEKFIESGVILKYSILFLVFNFMLQINFNIMAGIGKIKDRVKIISIALVFNFIMNFILIQHIGVYGAALATGMGWILIFVLSEIFLRKHYLIKFDTL
ncbi:oligosaccharide flippase family protein, partial [Candidatus Gracilibacteria bacterium]|nr:oligosaccharide flippase family protein [Candidatus Gracilibacteria bacterium]